MVVGMGNGGWKRGDQEVAEGATCGGDGVVGVGGWKEWKWDSI